LQYHLYTNPELLRKTANVPSGAILLRGSSLEIPSDSLAYALDDLVDSRHAWLDDEAVSIISRLENRPILGGEKHDSILDQITLAYLNGRCLLADLVRLLSPIVYFTEIQPLKKGDRIVLHMSRKWDSDYVDLLTEMAQTFDVELKLIQYETGHVENRQKPTPWVHRQMGNLASLVEPRFLNSSNGRRVILCGDRATLDPLCAELVDRGTRVWWLGDQFSLGIWLQWRHAGVGQLTCQSDRGRKNHIGGNLPHSIQFRGVNLSPVLGRKIVEQMQKHGRRQTQMVRRIVDHFEAIRPDAILLSEDQSPLARAAVAVARHHGAKSYVIQKDAPTVRFDFAPLVADHFLAWGDSSQKQLLNWGIASSQITPIGSPRHDPILSNWKKDLESVLHSRIDRKSQSPQEALRSLLDPPIAESITGPIVTGPIVTGPIVTGPIVTGPIAGPQTDNSDISETVTEPAIEIKDKKTVQPKRFLLLLAAATERIHSGGLGSSLHRPTYARMLRETVRHLSEEADAQIFVKLPPGTKPDSITEMLLRKSNRTIKVGSNVSLKKLCEKADGIISFFSPEAFEATLFGLPVIQIVPPSHGNECRSNDQSSGFTAVVSNESELSTVLKGLIAGDHIPSPDGPMKNFVGWEQTAASRTVDLVFGSAEESKEAQLKQKQIDA
jgi:hypothetical protein